MMPKHTTSVRIEALRRAGILALERETEGQLSEITGGVTR